jgi:hypothetical protein
MPIVKFQMKYLGLSWVARVPGKSRKITCQVSDAPAENKPQAKEKRNKPQTKESKTPSVLCDSESQVSAGWL